jgi:cadmium resistance protein CadD (predicted permease)
VWHQVVSAAGAFAATNFDDILILTLLFSRLDQQLRGIHIVLGQVLGFGLLIVISLSGFFGRSLLPLSWLGLLGLLPISLGISGVIGSFPGTAGNSQAPAPPPLPPLAGGGPLGSVLAVASLTVANGSDNIGVYLPLFVQASLPRLVVILATFAAGLLVWCLAAWQLSRLPGLAEGLHRQAGWLMPLVLIVLGAEVLLESRCLQDPPLAVLSLICLLVMAFGLLRHLESQPMVLEAVRPRPQP